MGMIDESRDRVPVTEADRPIPTADAFSPYDFAAPLDFEAWLDAVPATHAVFARGLTNVARHLGDAAMGIVRDHGLTPLGKYPLRVVVACYIEVAEATMPEVPVREGLRRLCHHVYPVFRNAPVGKALFAGAEHDPQQLVSRACALYDEILEESRFVVVDAEPGARHVVVDYANLFTLRAMDIGNCEGVLLDIGLSGRVLLCERTPQSGFMRIEW